DKDVRYLEEVPCGEGTQVPLVKEKGPPVEEKGDEQPRIFKAGIHKPRLKRGSHRLSTGYPFLSQKSDGMPGIPFQGRR
ncbi:MAG: hypothetical protein V1758_05330, partial [Pseudomonadota bacterium]